VLASCAAALPAMNATPIPMSASFLTTPLLLDRLAIALTPPARRAGK
jgi:hypothetical protein